MKPCLSLRTLLFTGVLLLSVGAASRLFAQDSLTIPDESNPQKIVLSANPGVVKAPTRTYTGVATQTSAAGVKTTGTVTVNFYRGGGLDALITLNGVPKSYSGEVLASSSLLTLTTTGTKPVKTSGVLNPLTVVDTQEGKFTSIFIDGQVPVIVNKTVAYGGIQNDDGSSLTFRAARDTK